MQPTFLIFGCILLAGFCTVRITEAQGYYGNDNEQQPAKTGKQSQYVDSGDVPTYEDSGSDSQSPQQFQIPQRCMAEYPPQPQKSGTPSKQNPRNPQEQPRYPQEEPKRPQDQPRNPQEQPRRPQEQPRYPQEEPRNQQKQPRLPQEQPEEPKDDPKSTQEQPRYPQQEPENPQERPENPRVQPQNKQQLKYPLEQPRNPQGQPRYPEEQPGNPQEQLRNPQEQPMNPQNQKQPWNPQEQPRNPQGQPRYPEEQPRNPQQQPRNPQEQPKKPQRQPENPQKQPEMPEEQPRNPQGQPRNPEEQPEPTQTQNRKGGAPFQPNNRRQQQQRPELSPKSSTAAPDEIVSEEEIAPEGAKNPVQPYSAPDPEADPDIDPRIKAPPKSSKQPTENEDEPASLDTEGSPRGAQQTLSNLPSMSTDALIKIITDLNNKLQSLEESQRSLNKNVDNLQARLKAIPAKKKEATQDLVSGKPDEALQKWNELGENVDSEEQLQNQTAELVTDALEQKAPPPAVMDFVHEIPNKPTQISAYNAVADKMAESDEIQETMNWKEMTPYCINAGRDTGPNSPTTRKMLDLQNQMRLKANQPIAQGSILIQEQRFLPAANIWLNLVQDIPENPKQLATNMKAMMIRTYAKNPFNLPSAFRFILILPESQGIYKKVAYNCLLDEMKANGHSYDPSNSRQGQAYRVPQPQLQQQRGQRQVSNNEGYKYY